VTLDGFNEERRTGPITLDNVIVDNVGPQAVGARYSDIDLGPGNVNFMPTGLGVSVTGDIQPGSVPRACSFPPIPVPQPPPGWAW
jgi:hypothetical protein